MCELPEECLQREFFSSAYWGDASSFAAAPIRVDSSTIDSVADNDDDAGGRLNDNKSLSLTGVAAM